MQLTDLQFENFIKICKEKNEFLFGDMDEVRNLLEDRLATQGYWSGISLQYHLDGDDWITKGR